MAIQYPFKNKKISEWDKMTLGAVEVPGIVTAFNVVNSYVYDVPKAKGKNSADVQFQGINPRTIDVSVIIYNEDDFNKFLNGFVKSVNARLSSKETVPLEVGHPLADMFSIKSVFLTDINVGQPNAANGFVFSFKLLENRKPVDAKASTNTEPKKPKKTFAAEGIPPKPGNPAL